MSRGEGNRSLTSYSQPRSQGFPLLRVGRVGKDPGIGWQLVTCYQWIFRRVLIYLIWSAWSLLAVGIQGNIHYHDHLDVVRIFQFFCYSKGPANIVDGAVYSQKNIYIRNSVCSLCSGAYKSPHLLRILGKSGINIGDNINTLKHIFEAPKLKRLQTKRRIFTEVRSPSKPTIIRISNFILKPMTPKILVNISTSLFERDRGCHRYWKVTVLKWVLKLKYCSLSAICRQSENVEQRSFGKSLQCPACILKSYS